MALDEIVRDSIFLKSFLMGSGAMLYGFVTYSIGYGVYKFGSYLHFMYNLYYNDTIKAQKIRFKRS
mgnify:CR=1 FL=1